MRGRFTYSLGQSGPGQGSDGDPDKGPQRGCMSLGQSGPGQGSDGDPDKGQTGTRTRVSRGPGQGSPTRVHVVCQTEGSGPCKSPNLSLSRGGGSTSRLGGRELTLLCGFNQYILLQNRDNSGLLGTSLYCSLKFGGAMPPQCSSWGGGRPPCPPCGAPPAICNRITGLQHTAESLPPVQC